MSPAISLVSQVTRKSHEIQDSTSEFTSQLQTIDNIATKVFNRCFHISQKETYLFPSSRDSSEVQTSQHIHPTLLIPRPRTVRQHSSSLVQWILSSKVWVLGVVARSDGLAEGGRSDGVMLTTIRMWASNPVTKLLILQAVQKDRKWQAPWEFVWIITRDLRDTTPLVVVGAWPLKRL